jgi:hypothetical protein
MNDIPYILMLIMSLSINYFAFDYEKELDKKETELIEMQETLGYVFQEGMDITNKLNKCKKQKIKKG